MFMVVKGSKNSPPIITLPDTLELRLPYYDEAKEVDILDENSNIKLKINLSDYIKPTIAQTESGNPPSNISFMGIKLGRINPSQPFQMIWDLIHKIIGL